MLRKILKPKSSTPRSLAPSPFSALSPAERCGLAAILAAVLLSVWAVRLAILPLALFVLACWTAPFFPQVGFFLPIVSRGSVKQRAVALTFDDGPDPRSTPHVLKALRQHRVTATFFVTGKKAAAHPDLIREILADGHCLGNHTYRHDNLVMFKSVATVVREIEAAQEVLRGFGITALAFRPPVGVTGPRLRPALAKTGHFLVNFSCRASDCGNRRIRHLAERILKCCRPGGIILLHDAPPHPPALLDQWTAELERILAGLEERRLAVLPLSELIGRPVMVRENEGTGRERNTNSTKDMSAQAGQ